MPRKRSEPDFEQCLAELETLVKRMEEGQHSLEDSLKSFERGVYLVRTCQHALKAAEQRVQLLMTREDKAVLEDFAQPESGESPAART